MHESAATSDLVFRRQPGALMLNGLVWLAFGLYGVWRLARPGDSPSQSKLLGVMLICSAILHVPWHLRGLVRGAVLVRLTDFGIVYNNDHPWPFKQGRFAVWGDVIGFGIGTRWGSREMLIVDVYGQYRWWIGHKWLSDYQWNQLRSAITEHLIRTQGVVPQHSLPRRSRSG